MNLIFLGPPGAGKGTQAARLADAQSMQQISTGDLFRSAIREKTDLGLRAQAFMDKGELVPDEVVIGMVAAYLPRVTATGGFILDGFPRTVEQAEALAAFAPIDAVVSFDLDDQIIVQRLTARRICTQCGKIHSLADLRDPAACPECGGELIQRADDNEATILRRLEVYHQQTEPLIAYYEAREMLKRVEADAPILETYQRLRKALGLTAE